MTRTARILCGWLGMNKDTVTGILGALVLVAAMTGVFFYERGQFHEYPIAWGPGAENTTTVNGASLSHGADRTHDFEIVAVDALVAGVTVEVTWDEFPDDRFIVEVTGPEGTTARSEDSGGSVSTTIAVQATPEGGSYADREEQGALTQAWSAVNETAQQAGQGPWTVRVTLEDAMRPNDIDVLDPEEGQNDYTLTFTWSTWEPVVE